MELFHVKRIFFSVAFNGDYNASRILNVFLFIQCEQPRRLIAADGTNCRFVLFWFLLPSSSSSSWLLTFSGSLVARLAIARTCFHSILMDCNSYSLFSYYIRRLCWCSHSPACELNGKWREITCRQLALMCAALSRVQFQWPAASYCWHVIYLLIARNLFYLKFPTLERNMHRISEYDNRVIAIDWMQIVE